MRKIMFTLARQNGIAKQARDTWQHSSLVWSFAEKIVRAAIKNKYRINTNFLRVACYVHDLGRALTGSKASLELLPAIHHAYEGYYLLKHLGYPTLARVCISHVGGTGLDSRTNAEYGFPPVNIFPDSLEECIVAYADCRIGYRKAHGSAIEPFKYAYARFSRYRGAGKRLMQQQKLIRTITGGTIK